MAKHKKDPKSNFIQNGRIGTHLRNPSIGYKMPGLSEVHHILCHSCVQDAAIFVEGTDKAYILKCLAITSWDVNNSDNLIGLPKKWSYVLDYAGHLRWDKLPCHQHDHGRFTEAVKAWLKDHVWTKLMGRENDCDVNPRDIKSLLDGGSTYWLNFLTSRGSMHGGTKLCWDERFGSKNAVWYIPFSMAKALAGDIPRREPPPANITSKLGRIMQMLK